MSRSESLLRLGLVATVLGIVIAATASLQSAQRNVGGVLVVAGWLAAAYGLHRYGREG